MANLSDNLAGSQPEVSPLPLTRIARRSAADEVRAQLVELIESGRLQVNDRLPSEAELGRLFGVSRPVIREALHSLQALGLTEPQAGRGTFVASNVAKMTLSFGQYSSTDLNEIRRHLEVPAACLAAQRRTDEDVGELRQLLDEHDLSGTTEEAVRYDALFHCAIARASGNLLFLRMIEDLREILQEQSLAVSALRNRKLRAVVEHRAVLDAIGDRDSEAAGAAMTNHLDAVEEAIRLLARQRSKIGNATRTRRGVIAQAGRNSSQQSRERELRVRSLEERRVQ